MSSTNGFRCQSFVLCSARRGGAASLWRRFLSVAALVVCNGCVACDNAAALRQCSVTQHYRILTDDWLQAASRDPTVHRICSSC